MTDVPEHKPFKSSITNKAIYCFPKGTSEADKQHDIAQIEEFIAHVKAKRTKKQHPMEGTDHEPAA